MKLVTVETIDDNRQWLGALRDDGSDLVLDLRAAALDRYGEEFSRQFASMLCMIDGGKQALQAAHTLLSHARKGWLQARTQIPGNMLRWKSPLPQPPQIRDCLMFEDHLVNAYAGLRKTRAALEPDPEAALAEFDRKGLYHVPDVWYERPIYYKANRFAVIGSDEDVIMPEYAETLDYELEFACVLNSKVKNVDEAEARDRIFGFTIFNDVSARQIQSREMQGQLGPAKGKDFDTGNVFGPCIATADEIDEKNLTMVARVNGEEVARGNSASAKWSFEKVIAYMSRSETLMPGEIIGSGTVGGGCGLENGVFLNPGDTIELEVEGIGTLRNRIAASAQ